MSKTESPGQINDGAAALALMVEALALIDRWDGGPEVGAQLDLAICRLRSRLGLDESASAQQSAEYCASPWSDSSSSFAA